MSLRLAALVVFVLVGCSDLPELPADSCGNGVIDPGEECDTFGRDGARCRGAAESNACRLDCSKGGACPSGWACSKRDGLCREPAGSFAATPITQFEVSAARVQVADFDGDGQSDLLSSSAPDYLGRSTLRALFFDDVARGPVKALSLASDAISTQIADVDGDGRSDVLFSANLEGMSVLGGRADRTFSPVPYARFPMPPGAHLRVARVMGVDNFFGQYPVIFGELGEKDYRITPGDDDTLLKTLARLDRSPTELVSDPLTANIVDGAGRECDELLWAWKDDDRVWFINACDPGNKLRVDAGETPKALFQLPSDKVARSPVAVDVNGDGHLDLLVSGAAHTWIAFGRGDGTFSGRPDLSTGSAVAEIECDVVSLDGSPDIVGASCGEALAGARGAASMVVFSRFVMGIASVAPSTRFPEKITLKGIPMARRTSGVWTVARVADLDGNGIPDVVAGSSAAPDVDLLRGTPLGLMNPGKLATEGPIGALDIGEYDGDLMRDVAILETGVGGPGVDAVSLAYGRYLAAPEPPLRMGLFSNVRQMGTVKLGGLDAIEQLGVVFETEATDQIALLQGLGARQLVSDFGLIWNFDGKAVQASPYFVAAGRLDGDDRLDVALFALDGAASTNTPSQPHRWWIAKGKGGGQFQPASPGPLETGFSGFAKSDAFDVGGGSVAVLRTGDLDGDGHDEVVVLAPSPTTPPRGATLTVVKPGADGNLAQGPTIALPDAALGAFDRFDLALKDVDGDGRLDAVVLVGNATKTTLAVAWGGGAGLDVAGATALPLPAGAPVAFTHAQLDLDPALELVVASDASVWTLDLARRAPTWTKLDVATGNALGVGDFDRDGIPDLVMLRGNRASIHLGAARKP